MPPALIVLKLNILCWREYQPEFKTLLQYYIKEILEITSGITRRKIVLKRNRFNLEIDEYKHYLIHIVVKKEEVKDVKEIKDVKVI